MSEPTENETPPEGETTAEEKPVDQTDNAEEPSGGGDKPLVRRKRALIDVPARHNIGADGNPDEEFD